MTHKPLMIVGEAWGEQEEIKGQPFVGPSGKLLRGLLYQVGIDRQECHFTNVFNFRPPNNSLSTLFTSKTDGMPNYRPISPGKYVHKKYASEIARLFAEVDRVNPNLILALGNTPLWALCKKSGIKKYRGSPLLTHDGQRKVLPTWHPAAVLRQWELRPVLFADLTKASKQKEFPELNRPRRLIYLEPSIKDIDDFYAEHLKDQPFISTDVETKEGQITEVGYSTADGKHCIVIPFWSRESADGNYWKTLEEELEAWKRVRYINARHRHIGQNFSYDMQYFWRTVHIPVPKFHGDTMLMHHALQPELEKGLGFLGSVYTDEPSWKFMRTDHTTLKKGDE